MPTLNSPLASRMMGKLEIAPATTEELSYLCHAHRASINLLLIAMKAKKLIYIHSWVKTESRGPASRVWALGDRPDAKRPEPKTNAQKIKDWRKRTGEDGHRAKRLRQMAKRIAKGSTFSGLLGL